MSSALRTKILNAKDIKTKIVPVPAWDCDLEVRGLTGAERDLITERARVKETVINDQGKPEEVTRVDDRTLKPLLVIASCFDPATGEKVFEDTDAEGIENKSAEALDIVVTEILKLNGMSTDVAKAIEKNSGATAGDASTSA